MDAQIAAILFVLFFVFRYTRLLVGIWANLTYKRRDFGHLAKYAAGDATIIVPTTFKDAVELMACLESINACRPAKLIIVTADAHVKEIRELCKLRSLCSVLVLGVEHLNKRHQLLKGLEHVGTEIVVFADDNVIWPTGYMLELLAIFDNPRIGAGGTRQHVKRSANPSIWNFLAISYLERRVFNNITTQAIDGSISTLSGRTAAYRTRILKTDAFFEYFTTDSWLGRRLNTDDDKCLTRYVYSSGWHIAIQGSVSIETTMEDGPKYIEQTKRWARSHWRGNFTVMTNERYWYSQRYFWGLYVIYIGQFQSPALLIDGILFWLLFTATGNLTEASQQQCLWLLSSWIVFSKLVKLVPHLCRYPQDTKFIPVSLLFSYLHGIINVYSLCTLTNTAWGSQQLSQLEQPHVIGGSMVELPPDGAEEPAHRVDSRALSRVASYTDVEGHKEA